MHRYSNIELSDIIFAYGNAYGNASLAASIYQERYPDSYEMSVPGADFF